MSRNVYILLSMSGTRFSKLLRLFSGLEYTHVSLSLDSRLDTLYSFGRRKMKTPWIAGFIEEHPYTGVFDKYNPSCELLRLSISDAAYHRIEKLIKESEESYNKMKYNFSGLLFTFVKVPKHLKNKYTCTQYVAYLLDQSKAVQFNKPVSLVLPSDYYNLESESVFRGRLHEYVMQTSA